MQKFTIFTIIFSLTVISVMTELVINNYLETKKEILKASKTSVLNTEVFNDETTTAEKKVSSPIENTEIAEETTETDSEQTKETILTNDIVKISGLNNVNSKNVPFNGKLFQLVELVGLKSEDVTKLNFFEGENFVLTSYEIKFDDIQAVKELYSFIIDQSATKPNIQVNESNSFGDNSFYINNSNKKKTVFLVVRIGENLYGFEYAHKYHSNIIKIIDELKKY